MTSATGTNPPGASTEQQAALWVRGMFSNIAPKYDFLNHLLSFNIDRGWRKVLIARLQPVLQQSHAAVLDLCCGTGDVLLALRKAGNCRVLGVDFCHPMLQATQQKARAANIPALLAEGDALQLPFSDNSLDAISISFGFRNLANYEGGLRELRRVLKPAGILAVLEFSHPRGVAMRLAYGIYSSLLLPAVGTMISGSRQAYTYLPDSIRKFPKAEELVRLMQHAGFSQVDCELLTGGVAALHVASK